MDNGQMDTALINDIKFNCDVSDARYWGYFSICGLLMRYRDLYRSEQGLKPWTDIRRDEIAAWIEKKEARWPELEEKEFKHLTIEGKHYHPINDVETINQLLEPSGLIYGAGYGMYMKPTFFLADRQSTRSIANLTIHTSDGEHVRDLFTAPAMLQGENIFLRLEPLLILLVYKFSELNTRRITALEDAFSQYGFQGQQIIDDTFERRMADMAVRYAETLLLHEVAEYRENIPDWYEILMTAEDRKIELYLRALKDLIADTSNHGPYRHIIGTRDRAALGLSIALPEGYRRELFPEIKTAHAVFLQTENWEMLEETRVKGYERFIAERDRVVELFRANKEDFSRKLREHIDVR